MERYRVPELDGLRGLAILLVMIAHFSHGVIPRNRPFLSFITWDGGGGGLVGVQLFFVLSGYLITSLLVNEHAERGHVSFRDFYKRRVRRLMPALVALCAAFGVISLVVDTQPGVGGAIFHAMTYTSDLPFSFHLHDNGWLSHTWSLAVEEQFYLVWPAVVLGAMAWRGRTAVRCAAAVVLVATVALRHTLPLAMHGPRLEFAEYNMLRWDALMLGCLLALIRLRIPNVALLAAIAAGGVLTVRLSSPIAPWVYTVSTLACGAVVARAEEMRWLRSRWLVHLGLVSYSLYLWHLLILRYAMPGPISLGVTLLVAEASYRFIEVPCRRRLFPESTRPDSLRHTAR